MKTEKRCDNSNLIVVLHGDDLSDEFAASADHVESCESCQQRLTELAADEATWREISGSLRSKRNGSADEDIRATVAGFRVQRTGGIDVGSILAPARHPEMLGRLGRYEIESVIGVGGMGVVFKAHDSELNRPIALKTLAPHLANNGSARLRFSREGRAAAAVVHEHVVPIHGVETHGDVPFLVMHYVAGESLQERVDASGPLPVREVLRIGIQVAAGMAAAHAQGVVHRDVKPSNILMEKTVERVLLTDFGLARVADDAEMTRTGVIAGTPHYMSPEQAKGEPIDHRSDLFSLGSVLYFMTTGHPPFRAEGALAVLNRIGHEQHRPAWYSSDDIPDALSDAIDRLLEKNPRNRFLDAAEVQATLTALLAEIQQPVRGRLRSRSRFGRWYRQNRTRVGAIAIGILALCLYAVWFSAETETSNPPAAQINGQGAAEEKTEPALIDFRIDESSMLGIAVSQELKILQGITKIDAESIRKLKRILKPIVAAELSRNPEIRGVSALQGPISGKLLNSVANAAERVVADKKLYKQYRDDVKLRQKFQRTTAAREFVLSLDKIVGLTTKQWPAALKRAGELYEQGRKLTDLPGGSDVKADELETVLTDSQLKFYAKLAHISPRDFPENGINQPASAAHTEEVTDVLRAVAKMKVGQLEHELGLSAPQLRKIELFAKRVVSLASSRRLAAEDLYRKQTAALLAGEDVKFGGGDTLLVVSHPARVFESQQGEWTKFVVSILNDAQKKKWKVFQETRQATLRERRTYRLLFAFGSELSMTGKQLFATHELLSSNVGTATPNANGDLKYASVYGDWLKIPEDKYVAAMGDHNWRIFKPMLNQMGRQFRAASEKDVKAGEAAGK